MFVITDWGRVVETVILFAAFAPPAEFRAFDPPAAQVLPAGRRGVYRDAFGVERRPGG